MTRAYLRWAFQSVVLIIIQMVMFNNVRTFTFLVPVLYGYPFLKLPIRTDRSVLTSLGAIVGLCVDALMNTPGLNMAAFTLVGYLRNSILDPFVPDEIRDDTDEIYRPSAETLHTSKFILYLLICVTIHISTLFILEAFSTQLFTQTLICIVGSTIMTMLTFLVFDLFSWLFKRR